MAERSGVGEAMKMWRAGRVGRANRGVTDIVTGAHEQRDSTVSGGEKGSAAFPFFCRIHVSKRRRVYRSGTKQSTEKNEAPKRIIEKIVQAWRPENRQNDHPSV